MKKPEIDRFKSAKYSAQQHRELLSVMSPKSYSLYQLCNVLGLTGGGSIFCKLGIQIALIHSNSVEMIKNASLSFDQSTKLAMISPYLEEEKLDDKILDVKK